MDTPPANGAGKKIKRLTVGKPRPSPRFFGPAIKVIFSASVAIHLRAGRRDASPTLGGLWFGGLAVGLGVMADVANKYPENVTGKFYVDNQCIDCDLCRETAPANFRRNEDGGYSYVYKQPETPEEEALCKEAKDGCPVEAIGDDGGAT